MKHRFATFPHLQIQVGIARVAKHVSSFCRVVDPLKRKCRSAFPGQGFQGDKVAVLQGFSPGGAADSCTSCDDTICRFVHPWKTSRFPLAAFPFTALYTLEALAFPG
jgi:hypothetical protein